ncbi:phosphoadenosine phosphosulfate reductase family protein [Marinomonas mediterranea]|jgi:phosphoadenylylsulfate reductase (thioredoxin) (EC 1.8.4.8)|uniref:Phosphoadenylyl-sulfate reductase (Thioredoxin) n=1 Tax=Marinomonas mediterranea (strain ATCC 700492 / JCM 21426 / NBRC 103028 / MMB-1) TaxID=717774 RepID=F2K0H6_MARM1|nr:phosphoadenosine phosphosulfate reductase family protein [Marinomonas mediterranea]ADZ90960.1 Phosphoadenylyl-sulfate reductase (thioredoxin) [Marinomonas mediterranea MMB-1]WCN08996.1 phosphoadenosine phosphosulfate reductase family protein [Marinomonas mediterranea]WCN13030.1 phosphoadenosine phosphosulfate reductase family protein [Marinomonas mediterranea]WCN17103.1 phosphoadenosine phosphosulfate reductase family protein [Marinomonas mediterranea MMB-1]
MIDIEKANAELEGATPQAIIEWALGQANKPIVTTNFGPHEAVILHMATQVNPNIPVIWIDSGYNVRDTYKVAEEIIEKLNLNLEVYTPKVSAARRDAALGGIPSVDDEAHAEFTEQFKLEPFRRAMADQAPDIWLTAVRSEQTEFRKDMSVVETGPNGVVKVAPVLHWKEADMMTYLEENGLPTPDHYFDPTKAQFGRECGLHTKL